MGARLAGDAKDSEPRDGPFSAQGVYDLLL